MILEQILAELQKLNAHLANGASVGTAPAVQTAAAVVQPVAQPVTQPVAQPAVTGVTPEQIVALIQPHIGNPATKEALGVAMKANGVNSLPEARPDQYDALYAAFQTVIAQASAAQPAPNAFGGSII